MPETPEQKARQQIDAQLLASGWVVQDYKQFNPSAGRGLALREAPLKSGTCDYLLLVDRKALGVIEAKKQGTLLAGVAEQSGHYAENLPDFIQSTALQILYSRPYKQRLTEAMLKELEAKLKQPFGSDPVNALWHAHEISLAPTGGEGRGEGASVSSVKSGVKKNPACRFADLVALVRFALEQQPVLEPFAESVTTRFNECLMDKAKAGVKFDGDQLAWLNLIRDHIATSLSIEPDDFDYAPFSQRGGLGKAHQLFGEELPKLLDELNEALAA